MGRAFNEIKRLYSEKPIVLVLILYVIFSLAVIPKFSGLNNLSDIIVQSSDLTIIGCGLTFVILNGGIDFSVAATMGLGSIVGASIMNLNDGYLAKSAYGFIAAIAVMILIGLIIGMLNGIAVLKLRMPSFMATMSTNLIFGGLALFYTQSGTINNLPGTFKFIGSGKVLNVPFPIISALVVVLITNYMLSRTVFGRNVYAIGTNPKAAYISGLPVKRTIFKLFVICGFLAALGGIVMTARLGAGLPALGTSSFLDVVASVIIGGSSVFGGSGTILGTAAGALFITVLNNSMNLMNIQWYVIIIVKGLIIFIVALLDAARRYSR